MAAGLSVLRSAFAGISPRERRLLAWLGVALGVLLFVGFYFWSSSALDDIETERAASLDALRTIRNERPRIRLREAAHQRMLARFATRAPALTSFVESVSRDPNAPPPPEPGSGTEPSSAATGAATTGVPTTVVNVAAPAGGAAGAGTTGSATAATPNPNDTSVTVAEATDRSSPPVGHFQRRAVSIRLRRVNLQSLVNFMNRIDAATFPVAITSIRIRKVFGEHNVYDIDDMVIATWDRTDSAASHGGTQRRGTATPDNGSRSGGSTDDNTAPGARR